jgi:hypothetical protein
MYLLIVFVLNTNSLDFLILISNLCIPWINLDIQIFIKSNGVYSSLFWINVGIYRPSRRTWLLLLTLKCKDNRRYLPLLSKQCHGHVTGRYHAPSCTHGTSPGQASSAKSSQQRGLHSCTCTALPEPHTTAGPHFGRHGVPHCPSASSAQNSR